MRPGFMLPSWAAHISKFALLFPVFIAIAFFAAAAPSPRSAEALDGEEQSFLSIINNYRASNGLGPLQLQPGLNDVARWMANDMAWNDYFSHTDSLGRDPFTRMDQLGYAYNTWRGENLVAGTASAQASFEMWRGSPGHNENMLNPNYTVIGIARAYDASSTFGWYWATEFGGAGAAPPPPPEPAPPPPPAPAPEPAPEPYVPPAPAPAPEPAPEPVAPAPAEPQPAAPPPPAPTLAPEHTVVNTADTGDGMPWWHTLRTLHASWELADGGTFVEALTRVADAFHGMLPQPLVRR